MTVVGTRPELIRLSRVLSKLDEHCTSILVHTGQNYDYELNQIFFDELKIRKPDYFLNSAEASPVATIGRILMRIDEALDAEKVDAFLVLGDTNSCLAALAAKRRKIPVFHMEAGNRCFDQRVPEEINRKLIDHLADINLTYSSIAREYLIREGIEPDRVIKLGSPMKEVLCHHSKDILGSKILDDLAIDEKDYFLVSCHREENIESEINLRNFCETLNSVATEYGKPIIVSTHPRTRKKLQTEKYKFSKEIKFLKPLGFFAYNRLQTSSLVTLSDSGTITEESSILGFPALNIRETHERPEGMEEGAVVMSGLTKDRVGQSLEYILREKAGKGAKMQIVSDYDVDNVSEKVVRTILSYVDFVNTYVWRK